MLGRYAVVMTRPRSAPATAAWIAGLLTVAAVVLLAAVGSALVAGFWLVVAAAITWAGWALRSLPRAIRMVLATALVPILVLLTWEGGLFLVPAAIALVVASACTPSHPAIGPSRAP